MELMSTENYINSIKKLSLSELYKEKERLENQIIKLEKNIANDTPNFFTLDNKSILKIYNGYLSNLKKLIAEYERNISEKGDGSEYVKMLDEEYENMTDEEKNEVEKIAKYLENLFNNSNNT